MNAVRSAEIGDVGTALRDFRGLLADQQRVLRPESDQVLDLRRQIGLLEASSGDVWAARRTLANWNEICSGSAARTTPKYGNWAPYCSTCGR